MVGNKARVEECIAEEFKYKEIVYFTSVTSQRNTMSMHIQCSTMYIKMIMTMTLAFLNREAQLSMLEEFSI
jgi:hypothetical protein